jgi:hypothetical protein
MSGPSNKYFRIGKRPTELHAWCDYGDGTKWIARCAFEARARTSERKGAPKCDWGPESEGRDMALTATPLTAPLCGQHNATQAFSSFVAVLCIIGAIFRNF